MTVEQESPAQDSLEDKIAVAVDAYVELVASGTGEQIADLFAADGTVEDPIGTPVRTTRDEIVEFYNVIANMDTRTTVLNWKKIAGDTAVFEFVLTTGTAGMNFEITPVDIMVFDAEGKITSMRAVWQPSDLKQL
ncbi:nuclear transport factor 2 family protein [Gordonia sp. (in: high G+C Gram-positive bacteria)]|jgi:steroid delta-isomerase|uniref:nuclear transport factor 2 family protein n=1 Tax=Gordonia sp. (in: high G+C Gram-positive bacteria) TaxID=84139 RepID=UPI001DF9C72B|nr:nuclear transport factor 2 family protein [Gordonia sp. (in: high G+C Gram-positive bacteria)]MCB1294233.1 nuclear transport factor 2 family protein [Gordonia sp. (in: high G+C Gram-positive bacteria)]HMS76981.1 nuclear transport factor 2 family protein [Gordonia sp. (in: high G+C Gram-positive bacteria)]